MATVRSKAVPSFLMSAGARLTVTFFGGMSKPEFFMAVSIRSRLSRIALSGRPTTVNEGMPPDTLVSTSTLTASMPIRVAAESLESMGVSLMKVR